MTKRNCFHGKNSQYREPELWQNTKHEYDRMILFKVRNPKKERILEDTLQNVLGQMEARKYAAGLEQRGIEEARIRQYGFAFERKQVLIG
jgi:hypothetical protein